MKFTEGALAAHSGLMGDESLMQISIPIQPGNSGGPVVTEEGTVIGLIVSTAAVSTFFDSTGSLPQSVNWAIKAEAFRHLVTPGQEESASSRADAIARAREAVCRVEAQR